MASAFLSQPSCLGRCLSMGFVYIATGNYDLDSEGASVEKRISNISSVNHLIVDLNPSKELEIFLNSYFQKKFRANLE